MLFSSSNAYFSCFHIKNDYKKKANGINCEGLIAEEVADVMLYPVYRENGQVEGLDYSKFVPRLIKMVQLQQDEIDELRKEFMKLTK